MKVILIGRIVVDCYLFGIKRCDLGQKLYVYGCCAYLFSVFPRVM
jgi:hypothetical protein